MSRSHARIAAAMCAIALITGCATPEPRQTAAPEFDALLAFSDPAMCKFSDDAAKLIGGFVGGNGDTLRDDWILPGTIPAHLRNRFGPIQLSKHDGWLVIRTPTRGNLWGLPLVAIDQVFPEGGDPGSTELVFQAPVETVERVVRARGFVARANQDVAMTEPDALTPTISLHPEADDPRRSYLGCGYL